MSPIAPALDHLNAEVAALTARHGRRVDVASLGISDREGQLQLDPPSRISCNRACRLVRAADGWIAANLAREEDQQLIPAWLHGEGDDWDAIERVAPARTCADLLDDAVLLGLPVARVGEAASNGFAPPAIQLGEPSPRSDGPLRVVDLSALWAGPMCGEVLARIGAEVVKVESAARPDPTRQTMPDFYRRLNGAKRERTLDFAAPSGRAELNELFTDADMVITSARPRAFAGLGLDPAAVFAANPALVWVAITGHGWTGEAAGRVGFGDDTAAAGGLVRWTAEGEPRFLGDALADPVTGLTAALAALRALETGGGVLVDVAMAASAAAAAALCRETAAA
jgi:hypothetical protein